MGDALELWPTLTDDRRAVRMVLRRHEKVCWTAPPNYVASLARFGVAYVYFPERLRR